MKSLKTFTAWAGLALAAGILLSPISSEAGRFRGANADSGAYQLDMQEAGINYMRPTPGSGAGSNAADFVDTDSDGICDTYASGGLQVLDGSGIMMGRGGHNRPTR